MLAGAVVPGSVSYRRAIVISAHRRINHWQLSARVRFLVTADRRLFYFLFPAPETPDTVIQRSCCNGSGPAAAIADEEINGVKFSGQVLDGLDPRDLRGVLDQAKARLGSGVAVIVAVNEGKASIAAAVTDDLTGTISAVDLVRAGVAALGGTGGGGRPDMAQGGGPDGASAAAAIAAARAVIAA